MKKRMLISLCLVCLVLATVISCHKLPVSAAERKVPPYILDTKRKCSLDIVTDVKQKTAGEQLAIYQVGLVDATGLSLSFVLTEPFEQTEVDLLSVENSQRSKVVETLCQYIEEKQLQPLTTVQLEADGTAQVEVPQGAYLICQVNESETRIQAALVSLPCVSESLDEWIYGMQVHLKAADQAVPTGDMHDPGSYAALAIAAALLLMLLMFARRRERKN